MFLKSEFNLHIYNVNFCEQPSPQYVWHVWHLYKTQIIIISIHVTQNIKFTFYRITYSTFYHINFHLISFLWLIALHYLLFLCYFFSPLIFTSLRSVVQKFVGQCSHIFLFVKSMNECFIQILLLSFKTSKYEFVQKEKWKYNNLSSSSSEQMQQIVNNIEVHEKE